MNQKLGARFKQSVGLLALPALLASTQVSAQPTNQPSTQPSVPAQSRVSARPKLSTNAVAPNAGTSSHGTSTVLRAEGAPRVRRAVKSKVNKRVGIQAPTFGDFTYTAVLKNTMTMGRKYELEEVGGRNFFLTNELFTGFKHKSGWSLQGTAAIRQKNYNDESRNARGIVRDASVVVGHPAIVKTPGFELAGQFRAFIPTSNASRESGFRQFRYLSFADITMPKNWGLSNLFMPMFFKQDVMTQEFADLVIYNALELTHQTTKTVRFGIGNQTQIEHHRGTQTGMTSELYPFADLELIPNVLIEPKFYVPVFVSDLVDGAPQVVALSQLQAELYIKIGF